jgi:hypothetical protein
MIDGQEADLTSQKCDENGIKEVEFSPPKGPIFHYEEATNETFGDQPMLRDPLDKKYVHLMDSKMYALAGEGAHATRDIPANTVYVLYGGYILTKEQNQIFSDKTNELMAKNNWDVDHPDYVARWKYK